MQPDRLISLLMLLQARGQMTTSELAAELEVSELTIYRDILELSGAGIPVYGISGQEGGYQLIDRFRTFLTGLSKEEVRALFMKNMSANWLETKDLSFNVLLLLERVQLSWFPGWLPEPPLGIALTANPVVEWYLRHKCPDLNPWLDNVMAQYGQSANENSVYLAEQTILQSINDLLTYVVDPAVYDVQPFLKWDDRELTDLIHFGGKVVIDIGAGTGRLAFIAASAGARVVYAVEPVGNLRDYMQAKAVQKGLMNFYAVDGLITAIPFAGRFADVVMGGHVFGDDMESEYVEMLRVTKNGGMIILCPGSDQSQQDAHNFLLEHGFSYGSFEEPGAGMMRKYWKTVSSDHS